MNRSMRSSASASLYLTYYKLVRIRMLLHSENLADNNLVKILILLFVTLYM